MQRRFRREDEEVHSECVILEMPLRPHHGHIKDRDEVSFIKYAIGGIDDLGKMYRLRGDIEEGNEK